MSEFVRDVEGQLWKRAGGIAYCARMVPAHLAPIDVRADDILADTEFHKALFGRKVLDVNSTVRANASVTSGDPSGLQFNIALDRSSGITCAHNAKLNWIVPVTGDPIEELRPEPVKPRTIHQQVADALLGDEEPVDTDIAPIITELLCTFGSDVLCEIIPNLVIAIRNEEGDNTIQEIMYDLTRETLECDR